MSVSGSFFQLPDSKKKKKKKNYHCLIFFTSPSSEVFKFNKVEERNPNFNCWTVFKKL